MGKFILYSIGVFLMGSGWGNACAKLYIHYYKEFFLKRNILFWKIFIGFILFCITILGLVFIVNFGFFVYGKFPWEAM